MKKLIILVLLAALIAGAYISRPPDAQKSFAHFLAKDQGRKPKEANETAKGCEFVDHFLWIDVKQNGNVVYTNVFHRWFNRGEIKHAIDEDVATGKKVVKDIKESVK